MSAAHSEVAPEHQYDNVPDNVPDNARDNAHANAATSDVDLKAGRRKVARSRGVLSGVLLIILGAWAALAPFIGPYFDFGIEPKSGDAWHWTSGRGLYELLPGGVAVLAGIVLLLSASRVLTLLMSWLAALAGVWLVIGPTLDAVFDVGVGNPPGDTGTNKIVALTLLYFLATGAAITLVAGIALGRLSVHSVRDVQAAERRAEAEAAAEAQRQEAERREQERREAERQEYERRETERREHEQAESERRESERRDSEGLESERRESERVASEPRATDADHRDHDVDYNVVDSDHEAPGEHAGQSDTSDYDRGFLAGQQAGGAGGTTGERTASHPVTDGHDYRSGSEVPPAAQPVDGRDDATQAEPHDGGYRADPSEQTGSHAVDPTAPPAPAAPAGQGSPPAPGYMDQYRYGAEPEQHDR